MGVQRKGGEKVNDMGQVYGNIHPTAALQLRALLGSPALVETGTFRGETVEWAIKNGFDKIISVDICKGYVDSARERIRSPKATFIHGDSRAVLPRVCKELAGVPTLFWLDAHYAGIRETYDPLGCALADEIAAINEHCKSPHAIMIDDYWAVVSKNKYIYFQLLRAGGREIAVFDDIVIACERLPDCYAKYKEKTE
jgi:hypothetical protein